jgi:hypothetical protein
MRKLGFQTKCDNDDVFAQYAALFFDLDIKGKTRHNAATPQAYHKSLFEQDPLLNVPDVASKFKQLFCCLKFVVTEKKNSSLVIKFLSPVLASYLVG